MEILYTVVAQQPDGRGDAIFLAMPESRRIQNDEGGYYLRCVHCKKRIAMMEVPSIPTTAFVISPEQNCNQAL